MELMKDRLMKLMKRRYVTPIEALEKCQCFSLAQRVSEWQRAGVRIDKKWVDLASGKRVRAYRVF